MMVPDVMTKGASDAVLRITVLAEGKTPACSCCGHLPASGIVARDAYCLTCLPAFALDETDIDSVARVMWLPEMDQGVLSRLVTGLHTACAAQNVTMTRGTADGRAQSARGVFAELRKRESEAVARIGTDRPSELRATLRHMRATKMTSDRVGESGLRILSLGTWFATDPGCYEAAAKAWAQRR